MNEVTLVEAVNHPLSVDVHLDSVATIQASLMSALDTLRHNLVAQGLPPKVALVVGSERWIDFSQLTSILKFATGPISSDGVLLKSHLGSFFDCNVYSDRGFSPFLIDILLFRVCPDL